MRNAIIFGGAGFLGGHIVDELVHSGYEVTVFDVREPSIKNSKAKYVIGDVLNLKELLKISEGKNIALNFAGISDIEEARSNPLTSYTVNVIGNANILEAVRQQGVAQYLFASSVYVYSSYGSIYRASKQSCEQYIEAYCENFGIPFKILRYGSLYGPRSDRRNTVFRFLSDAVNEGVIRYEGSPDSLREYIHVYDAAKLTRRVIEEVNITTKYLTLTGQEKFRVRDLIRMIQEILQTNIEVHYNDRNDDSHYEVTPYAFNPRLGHKLVPNEYVDIGQGIIDTIAEIYPSRLK